MSGDPDWDLVRRVRAGHRDALDELLRRHYDRIYGICRRISGNDADAADATQMALLAIVRGIDRFDGRALFSTWSYRVATNACLDELRKRNRRPTPAPLDDYDEYSQLHHDPSAESFDETLVEQDRLSRALEQLPTDFREPVVLRDIGGLDYAEIAQELVLPPGTVRSRIARGRAKLAELLADGNQATTGRRPTTES